MTHSLKHNSLKNLRICHKAYKEVRRHGAIDYEAPSWSVTSPPPACFIPQLGRAKASETAFG